MEDLRDLITGRPISEYEDEPIRQDAEALLLELGYQAEDIQVDAERRVEVDGRPETIRVDLLVSLAGRPAMALRCARGSLVTREREAVAAARAVCDPWAPLAAVTNRYDAVLLDTASAGVLQRGMEAIPDPARLARLLQERPPRPTEPAKLLSAARVYLAMASLQGECSHRCQIQESLRRRDE